MPTRKGSGHPCGTGALQNVEGRDGHEQDYLLCFQYGQRLCGAGICGRQHDCHRLTAVENGAGDNMYQMSELDYLIHNDPVAYSELILNGDPRPIENCDRIQNTDAFEIEQQRRPLDFFPLGGVVVWLHLMTMAEVGYQWDSGASNDRSTPSVLSSFAVSCGVWARM